MILKKYNLIYASNVILLDNNPSHIIYCECLTLGVVMCDFGVNGCTAFPL